jgi:hypothetical protein
VGQAHTQAGCMITQQPRNYNIPQTSHRNQHSYIHIDATPNRAHNQRVVPECGNTRACAHCDVAEHHRQCFTKRLCRIRNHTITKVQAKHLDGLACRGDFTLYNTFNVLVSQSIPLAALGVQDTTSLQIRTGTTLVMIGASYENLCCVGADCTFRATIVKL